MNNLEYIRSGDYLIPNLTLSEQPKTPLGKYGRMRKTYLREHRPALYSHLLLSEKLYPHLLEADQTANERLAQLLPPRIKAAGITEQLKATDQMRWVGLMNTVKAQVEEIIFAELIYDKKIFYQTLDIHLRQMYYMSKTSVLKEAILWKR